MNYAYLYTLFIAFATAAFGVTAYVVFWKDQSGWWFLLTLIILESVKWSTRKDEKEEE